MSHLQVNTADAFRAEPRRAKIRTRHFCRAAPFVCDTRGADAGCARPLPPGNRAFPALDDLARALLLSWLRNATPQGGIRDERRRHDGGDGGVDQHRRVQGAELRAQGPGDQPDQGLPAPRGVLRGRRVRGDAPLRARLAGLHGVLPQQPLAALPRAVPGGLRLDDRGRGGLRRAREHGRGAEERPRHLQAGDDRGLHLVHGGGHRRRSQGVPRRRARGRVGAEGVPGGARAHAELHRLAHHRLRQHAARHRRGALRRALPRGRAARRRSTSSPASTPTWRTSASCGATPR